MKRSIERASWSTPQKSLFLAGAMAAEYPVPTGLMKTRSERSSKLSGLSSNGYGAGGVKSGKDDWIRFGPNEPSNRKTDDEPGPPL